MREYIENLKKNITKNNEGATLSQFLVYGIERDYNQLLTDFGEGLIFVDGYRDAFKEKGSVIQVTNLLQIEAMIESLPAGYTERILVDSPDNLSGELQSVLGACAKKNIDLFIVMGVTQKGSFFNYGRLIEARANKVWFEKACKPQSKTNDLHEIASARSGGHCEACGNLCNGLEMHHVLSGSGRRKQQARPETVRMLCYDCHRGTNGVHGKNGLALNLKLKIDIQSCYFGEERSEEEVRTLMGGKLYY